MNMVMVHPFTSSQMASMKNLRKQSEGNFVEQLDVAARDFQMKRLSVPDPEKINIQRKEQPMASQARPERKQEGEGFRLRPVEQEKRQQPDFSNLRSKSSAAIKRYYENDEGIFMRQSRAYNIISGYPSEVHNLRVFPKLSSELKESTFFTKYLSGNTQQGQPQQHHLS
jgi:hypothetical protein